MSSRDRTIVEWKREYVSAMGADLGKQFYLLSEDCQWLHVYWHQYEALFGSGPGRVAILNGAAGTFFRVVQDALLEATLLRLTRLTDPPKGTLTLTRLPRLVGEKIRPDVQRRILDLGARCTFARDWRNRRIAHRNLGLALADRGVRPLAPASRKKITDAIEAVADLLNAVELHYRNATHAYEAVFSAQDADDLLYVLRDGLEAEAARRKRLESGNADPEDWHPRPPL